MKKGHQDSPLNRLQRIGNNMYKRIETDRLLIRPIHTGDADFIKELVNSEGWIKFIGDRKITGKTAALTYIENILNNKNYFYNVFELKQTGQPIGIITFLYRENQNHPDIGFAILPQFEQKGYTFEAARTYLNEVLQFITTGKIIAITLTQNTNSIKLLERLGLKFCNKFTENGIELCLYEINIYNYMKCRKTAFHRLQLHC